MLKKTREEGLDKFYTSPEYAKKLIDKVLDIYKDITFIVEPSAGNGSFYNQLPENIKKVGIDIEPEHISIKKQDFFSYVLDNHYREPSFWKKLLFSS
jgi:hypothetical protein